MELASTSQDAHNPAMRNFTSIGHYFKTLRREKGLTQQELAEQAGVSRTYLVGLEAGRVAHPQYRTREKLHSVLGTSDSEIQDFGLLHIDDYGFETIPDPSPQAVPNKPSPTGPVRAIKAGGKVFLVTAGPAEVEDADGKRAHLALQMTGFLLTQDRLDALSTILRSFAAEDHAPEDWDMPTDLDDVPF